MKTKKDTITEDIIKYFEAHADVFTDCIEELDGYNGYLGDDRFIPMDELPDIFSNAEPLELLNRAFYGYDADTYTTDAHGDRVYGAFNPNREYFTFNGYGNLISTNYKDYSCHLDKWAIDAMRENREYVDTIDDNAELSAMFTELDATKGEC